MTTTKNSDELVAPHLENVSEKDRSHVKGVLLDIIFYLAGDLSYHHLSPFIKALLTNKLSYVAQRCSEVNLRYLGVYGAFIYEHVPDDKFMDA